MGPTWAHLGPTGPRWATCWPHELCYLESYGVSQSCTTTKFCYLKYIIANEGPGPECFVLLWHCIHCVHLDIRRPQLSNIKWLMIRYFILQNIMDFVCKNTYLIKYQISISHFMLYTYPTWVLTNHFDWLNSTCHQHKWPKICIKDVILTMCDVTAQLAS